MKEHHNRSGDCILLADGGDGCSRAGTLNSKRSGDEWSMVCIKRRKLSLSDKVDDVECETYERKDSQLRASTASTLYDEHGRLYYWDSISRTDGKSNRTMPKTLLAPLLAVSTCQEKETLQNGTVDRVPSLYCSSGSGDLDLTVSSTDSLELRVFLFPDHRPPPVGFRWHSLDSVVRCSHHPEGSRHETASRCRRRIAYCGASGGIWRSVNHLSVDGVCQKSSSVGGELVPTRDKISKQAVGKIPSKNAYTQLTAEEPQLHNLGGLFGAAERTEGKADRRPVGLSTRQNPLECQVDLYSGTALGPAGSGDGGIARKTCASPSLTSVNIVGFVQVADGGSFRNFPLYGTFGSGLVPDDCSSACWHLSEDDWQVVVDGADIRLRMVDAMATIQASSPSQGCCRRAPCTSSLYGFKIANADNHKVKKLVPLFTKDHCTRYAGTASDEVKLRPKRTGRRKAGFTQRKSDLCDIQMYRQGAPRDTFGKNIDGPRIKLCGVALGMAPPSPGAQHPQKFSGNWPLNLSALPPDGRSAFSTPFGSPPLLSPSDGETLPFGSPLLDHEPNLRSGADTSQSDVLQEYQEMSEGQLGTDGSGCITSVVPSAPSEPDTTQHLCMHVLSNSDLPNIGKDRFSATCESGVDLYLAGGAKTTPGSIGGSASNQPEMCEGKSANVVAPSEDSSALCQRTSLGSLNASNETSICSRNREDLQEFSKHVFSVACDSFLPHRSDQNDMKQQADGRSEIRSECRITESFSNKNETQFDTSLINACSTDCEVSCNAWEVNLSSTVSFCGNYTAKENSSNGVVQYSVGSADLLCGSPMNYCLGDAQKDKVYLKTAAADSAAVALCTSLLRASDLQVHVNATSSVPVGDGISPLNGDTGRNRLSTAATENASAVNLWHVSTYSDILKEIMKSEESNAEIERTVPEVPVQDCGLPAVVVTLKELSVGEAVAASPLLSQYRRAASGDCFRKDGYVSDASVTAVKTAVNYSCLSAEAAESTGSTSAKETDVLLSVGSSEVVTADTDAVYCSSPVTLSALLTRTEVAHDGVTGILECLADQESLLALPEDTVKDAAHSSNRADCLVEVQDVSGTASVLGFSTSDGGTYYSSAIATACEPMEFNASVTCDVSAYSARTVYTRDSSEILACTSVVPHSCDIVMSFAGTSVSSSQASVETGGLAPVTPSCIPSAPSTVCSSGKPDESRVPAVTTSTLLQSAAAFSDGARDTGALLEFQGDPEGKCTPTYADIETELVECNSQTNVLECNCISAVVTKHTDISGCELAVDHYHDIDENKRDLNTAVKCEVSCDGASADRYELCQKKSDIAVEPEAAVKGVCEVSSGEVSSVPVPHNKSTSEVCGSGKQNQSASLPSDARCDTESSSGANRGKPFLTRGRSSSPAIRGAAIHEAAALIARQQGAIPKKMRQLRFPPDVIAQGRIQEAKQRTAPPGEFIPPHTTRQRLSSLGHILPTSAPETQTTGGYPTLRSKSTGRMECHMLSSYGFVENKDSSCRENSVSELVSYQENEDTVFNKTDSTSRDEENRIKCEVLQSSSIGKTRKPCDRLGHHQEGDADLRSKLGSSEKETEANKASEDTKLGFDTQIDTKNLTMESSLAPKTLETSWSPVVCRSEHNIEDTFFETCRKSKVADSIPCEYGRKDDRGKLSSAGTSAITDNYLSGDTLHDLSYLDQVAGEGDCGERNGIKVTKSYICENSEAQNISSGTVNSELTWTHPGIREKVKVSGEMMSMTTSLAISRKEGKSYNVGIGSFHPDSFRKGGKQVVRKRASWGGAVCGSLEPRDTFLHVICSADAQSNGVKANDVPDMSDDLSVGSFPAEANSDFECVLSTSGNLACESTASNNQPLFDGSISTANAGKAWARCSYIDEAETASFTANPTDKVFLPQKVLPDSEEGINNSGPIIYADNKAVELEASEHTKNVIHEPRTVEKVTNFETSEPEESESGPNMTEEIITSHTVYEAPERISDGSEEIALTSYMEPGGMDFPSQPVVRRGILSETECEEDSSYPYKAGVSEVSSVVTETGGRQVFTETERREVVLKAGAGAQKDFIPRVTRSEQKRAPSRFKEMEERMEMASRTGKGQQRSDVPYPLGTDTKKVVVNVADVENDTAKISESQQGSDLSRLGSPDLLSLPEENMPDVSTRSSDVLPGDTKNGCGACVVTESLAVGGFATDLSLSHPVVLSGYAENTDTLDVAFREVEAEGGFRCSAYEGKSRGFSSVLQQNMESISSKQSLDGSRDASGYGCDSAHLVDATKSEVSSSDDFNIRVVSLCQPALKNNSVSEVIFHTPKSKASASRGAQDHDISCPSRDSVPQGASLSSDSLMRPTCQSAMYLDFVDELVCRILDVRSPSWSSLYQKASTEVAMSCLETCSTKKNSDDASDSQNTTVEIPVIVETLVEVQPTGDRDEKSDDLEVFENSLEISSPAAFNSSTSITTVINVDATLLPDGSESSGRLCSTVTPSPIEGERAELSAGQTVENVTRNATSGTDGKHSIGILKLSEVKCSPVDSIRTTPDPIKDRFSVTQLPCGSPDTVDEGSGSSGGPATDSDLPASASASVSSSSGTSWAFEYGPAPRRDALPAEEGKSMECSALLSPDILDSDVECNGYESDDDFDAVDAEMQRLEEKIRKFKQELGETTETLPTGSSRDRAFTVSAAKDNVKNAPTPHRPPPSRPHASSRIRTKHMSLLTKLETTMYDVSDSESVSAENSLENSTDLLFVKKRIKLKPGDRRCRSLQNSAVVSSSGMSADSSLRAKTARHKAKDSVHGQKTCQSPIESVTSRSSASSVNVGAVSRVARPDKLRRAGHVAETDYQRRVESSDSTGMQSKTAVDSTGTFSESHSRSDDLPTDGERPAEEFHLMHDSLNPLWGYLWYEDDGMTAIDFEGLDELQDFGESALLFMFEDDDYDAELQEEAERDVRESYDGDEADVEESVTPTERLDPGTLACSSEVHRSPSSESKKLGGLSFVSAFKNSFRRAAKYLGPKSSNKSSKHANDLKCSVDESLKSDLLMNALDSQPSLRIPHTADVDGMSTRDEHSKEDFLSISTAACMTTDVSRGSSVRRCSDSGSGEYSATPAICVMSSDEEVPWAYKYNRNTTHHLTHIDSGRQRTHCVTTGNGGNSVVPAYSRREPNGAVFDSQVRKSSDDSSLLAKLGCPSEEVPVGVSCNISMLPYMDMSPSASVTDIGSDPVEKGHGKSLVYYSQCQGQSQKSHQQARPSAGSICTEGYSSDHENAPCHVLASNYRYQGPGYEVSDVATTHPAASGIKQDMHSKTSRLNALGGEANLVPGVASSSRSGDPLQRDHHHPSSAGARYSIPLPRGFGDRRSWPSRK